MKFREQGDKLKAMEDQIKQILDLLKKPESVDNIDTWQEIELPSYLEHIWKIEKTIERLEMHIDTWCATIEGFANDPYCDLPPSWVKKAIDDSNRLRMRIFPNQKH